MLRQRFELHSGSGWRDRQEFSYEVHLITEKNRLKCLVPVACWPLLGNMVGLMKVRAGKKTKRYD